MTIPTTTQVYDAHRRREHKRSQLRKSRMAVRDAVERGEKMDRFKLEERR